MNAYLVILLAVAHEVVCVHQVRLRQVDEPVQDQTVSKICGAENFHQLIRRPLREEKFVPLVLHDTVITAPQVGRLGKTSLDSRHACSIVCIKVSGHKTLQALNLCIVI